MDSGRSSSDGRGGPRMEVADAPFPRRRHPRCRHEGRSGSCGSGVPGSPASGGPDRRSHRSNCRVTTPAPHSVASARAVPDQFPDRIRSFQPVCAWTEMWSRCEADGPSRDVADSTGQGTATGTPAQPEGFNRGFGLRNPSPNRPTLPPCCT
jgi:hypothetical protein